MTRAVPVNLTLGALVSALFAASLLVGPAALGLGESLRALLTGQGDAVVLIMREIRLPRAVLGLLVGAVLGLSGAAMQGYLRNPLAEPGLIGVSATAALGAVLALQTGLAAAFALALPIAALAGAAVSVPCSPCAQRTSTGRRSPGNRRRNSTASASASAVFPARCSSVMRCIHFSGGWWIRSFHNRDCGASVNAATGGEDSAVDPYPAAVSPDAGGAERSWGCGAAVGADCIRSRRASLSSSARATSSAAILARGAADFLARCAISAAGGSAGSGATLAGAGLDAPGSVADCCGSAGIA